MVQSVIVAVEKREISTPPPAARPAGMVLAPLVPWPASARLLLIVQPVMVRVHPRKASMPPPTALPPAPVGLVPPRASLLLIVLLLIVMEAKARLRIPPPLP